MHTHACDVHVVFNMCLSLGLSHPSYVPHYVLSTPGELGRDVLEIKAVLNYEVWFPSFHTPAGICVPARFVRRTVSTVLPLTSPFPFPLPRCVAPGPGVRGGGHQGL